MEVEVAAVVAAVAVPDPEVCCEPVVAAPVPVLDPVLELSVLVAAPAVPVGQTSDLGVSTPAAAQIPEANLMVASTSLLEQTFSRQHEMPLMKSLFRQTQAMSAGLQPAMLVPET